VLVDDGSALDLDRVTIADNAAGDGGGVAVLNGGSMSARDTAFTGNMASNLSGAIRTYYGALDLVNVEIGGNYAFSGGGGLHANNASDIIENATIHGNGAAFWAAGALLYGPALDIRSSTITGNRVESAIGYGGGVMSLSGGTAPTLSNTIIAGNHGSVGADLALRGDNTPTLSGIILGTNAIRRTFGDAVADLGADAVVLTSRGLDAGDVFAAIDPLTGGGLALDNGGAVKTVALAAVGGNPALGTAIPPTPDAHDLDGDGDLAEAQPFDARGVARGANPDIGAYEAPITDAPSLLVTTLADVMNNSDGVTLLREAIGWVNDGSLTGTITFSAAAFPIGSVIALNGAELVTSGAVTVDGDADDDGVACDRLGRGSQPRAAGAGRCRCAPKPSDCAGRADRRLWRRHSGGNQRGAGSGRRDRGRKPCPLGRRHLDHADRGHAGPRHQRGQRGGLGHRSGGGWRQLRGPRRRARGLGVRGRADRHLHPNRPGGHDRRGPRDAVRGF
jgi:hypothetical protein